MTTDLNWYAVAAEPQRERIAEEALRRIGLSPYVPRRRVEVRLRGRLREKRRPLMPGYVFVGIAPGREPWMALDDCTGVVAVVGFGNPPSPARIKAEVIGDLRYAEWRGWYDDERSRDARLRTGRQARVDVRDDDAAIAGRVGRIMDVLSDERVVLQFGQGRAQLPSIVAVRRLDELAVL